MDIPFYPFLAWILLYSSFAVYITFYYPFKQGYIIHSPFWNSISGSMFIFHQFHQVAKMIMDHEEGAPISSSEYFWSFMTISIVIMYFAQFWRDWKREKQYCLILAQLKDRNPEENQIILEQMAEDEMRQNPNAGTIGAPVGG